MSYFSLMSTLYTLNYHSSRLYKPRLQIYIHNVLPSDISWTCDSREIPLETYNKKKTECYYVVFFTNVYIIHTKLLF